jgi:glycogen(starch) synthase
VRVLVLTDLYPPHFLGGYELKCKLHVEELNHRGYDIHVLTSRWKAGSGTGDGNVHRLLCFVRFNKDLRPEANFPDPLRLSRRYNQLKWAFDCRRNYSMTHNLVKDLKPELIFVWNMSNVGISPVLAAQDQQLPTVFRLGDYWLADLKYQLCLQPNSLRRRYQAAILGLRDFDRLDLSHLLVVSHAVKRRYVELGFPAQNITVIPNGVPSHIIISTDDLATLPLDRHQLRVVLVGRLDPKKGVHIAIAAVAKLVREMNCRNVYLDIIGTGPKEYMRQLRDTSSALGIDDRVKFIGFVEHQQLLERFLEYSAVLIPSLWEEPLAGTIAEAMARGLPVIATNRGGSPEIISDGENGLLVRPGDPVMLANALKRLIRDPNLARKIRYRALRTVREKYTHERLVDQIEEHLQVALQRPSFVPAVRNWSATTNYRRCDSAPVVERE